MIRGLSYLFIFADENPVRQDPHKELRSEVQRIFNRKYSK